MDANKIEKLKTISNVSINPAEVAKAHEKIAAGDSQCVVILTWIIQQAAATGSCAAGEVALAGLFTLAELLFPEAVEILVPLEVIVEISWGAVCAEIGIAALGEQAQKYAEEWCSKI